MICPQVPHGTREPGRPGGAGADRWSARPTHPLSQGEGISENSSSFLGMERRWVKREGGCVLEGISCLCIRHVCNEGSCVFKKSPGSPSLGVAKPEFTPQALRFPAALSYPGCSRGSTVERC